MTQMKLALLTTLVLLAASAADVRGASDARASLVVYRRDTQVAEGSPTAVVVEIANQGDAPITVMTPALYELESDANPFPIEGHAHDLMMPPGSIYNLILRSYLPRSGHLYRGGGMIHESTVTIGPHESGFVKVDVPAGLMMPGTCYLQAILRAGGKQRAASEARSVACTQPGPAGKGEGETKPTR